MKKYVRIIRQALVFSIVMVVICGLLYPLALTGVSQLTMHNKANGSLVYVDGEAVGAEFVGQDFSDPRLFKCRPSAVNYNTYTQEDKDNGNYGGVSSGSSNYGATNPELKKRVNAEIEAFLKANPDVKREDLPVDLFTVSGSGLDPHITTEAAIIQIPAIAKASGISEDELHKIVENNTEGKVFGVFGEERVNVLGCNIEISKLISLD